MRSREEVARLMGAKDREIDDIQETEDGTVVTVRGTRTLIREDGSMVHGVAEPEVEIVGEVSEEGAERIAAHLNQLDCAVCGGTGAVGDEGEACPECQGSGIPPVGEVEGLADATVSEVLEWVDGDAEKAARALTVEEARDAPRSTLLAALRKLVV